MKKGISLIVLVITIIVLAILAGAIIITTQTGNNVVAEASEAVDETKLSNIKHSSTLAYATYLVDKDVVSEGETVADYLKEKAIANKVITEAEADDYIFENTGEVEAKGNLVCGDVALDNDKADIIDLSYIRGYLAGQDTLNNKQLYLADVTGDGVVNQDDVDYFTSHLAGWSGYEQFNCK